MRSFDVESQLLTPLTFPLSLLAPSPHSSFLPLSLLAHSLLLLLVARSCLDLPRAGLSSLHRFITRPVRCPFPFCASPWLVALFASSSLRLVAGESARSASTLRRAASFDFRPPSVEAFRCRWSKCTECAVFGLRWHRARRDQSLSRGTRARSTRGRAGRTCCPPRSLSRLTGLARVDGKGRTQMECRDDGGRRGGRARTSSEEVDEGVRREWPSQLEGTGCARYDRRLERAIAVPHRASDGAARAGHHAARWVPAASRSTCFWERLVERARWDWRQRLVGSGRAMGLLGEIAQNDEGLHFEPLSPARPLLLLALSSAPALFLAPSASPRPRYPPTPHATPDTPTRPHKLEAMQAQRGHLDRENGDLEVGVRRRRRV